MATQRRGLLQRPPVACWLWLVYRSWAPCLTSVSCDRCPHKHGDVDLVELRKIAGEGLWRVAAWGR